MANEGSNQQQNRTGGGETAPRRSQGAAANDAAQATGGAMRRGAEEGRDAMEKGAHAAGRTLREAGEIGAQTVGQVGEAAGDVARRGTRATVDGGRHIVEDAAEQLAEAGRSFAEVVQDTAQDLRRLIVLPAAANGGLRDMQQAMTSLVEGVVRTNLHATQLLFRLANPGNVVQLQRRLAREYFDVFVEGQATLLRAARRTAEETLRPLEERARELRQRQGDGQDGQRQRRGSRVADVMTRSPRIVSPDETVQQATRLMREEDTGVLLVGEDDRLVGMMTDRDVALRLVAEGKDPARTRVREVMTPEVRYVFEDDDLHRATETMAEQQVRRLPVLDRDRRLVGVVSVGDLATEGGTPRLAGQALAGIARESQRHNQQAAAE